MKKAVCVLLCLSFIFSFTLLCSAEEVSQNPVIVETVYPTDDTVVADIVITDCNFEIKQTIIRGETKYEA